MLKLDLQFFAEDTDFDLDSFADEFEKSWNDGQESETEDIPEPEESEATPEKETVDEPSEETPQEETQTEQPEPPPSNDTPQDNGRWAEMRRNAEEGRKYQDFIDGLAKQFGMTPEEYMRQVQQAQTEQKAQEQGIPVDVLNRLNDQEKQLSDLRSQDVLGKFQNGIEKVRSQYDLKETDPSIQETFKWMAQNGHIDEQQMPKMAFEDAYFLANRDSIIQKQVEAATQKSLADKKQRQEAAAVATDGAGTSQPDVDVNVGEDVLEFLKDAYNL